MKAYAVKPATRKQIEDLIHGAPTESAVARCGPPVPAAGSPFVLFTPPTPPVTLPPSGTLCSFSFSEPGLYMVVGSVTIRIKRDTVAFAGSATASYSIAPTGGSSVAAGAGGTFCHQDGNSVGDFYFTQSLLFYINVFTVPSTHDFNFIAGTSGGSVAVFEYAGGTPFHALRLSTKGMKVPIAGGSAGNGVFISGAGNMAGTPAISFNTGIAPGGGGASGGQFQIDVGSDIDLAFSAATY